MTAAHNDQWGIRHSPSGLIEVFQNGVEVASVSDSTYGSGHMGMLVAGWSFDRYGGGADARPSPIIASY